MSFNYPAARRDETVVDTYGSTKVADPYRHLEDPQAEETKQWVDKQNEIFDKFVAQCPEREQIRARLTETCNYEKVGCPFKRGDYYYFYKNTGLQNHSVLYQVQDPSNLSQAKVFFDPNTLSKDGSVSLSATWFSKDGKTMTYALSRSGSDWKTIYVRNTETGADLTDKLLWCKFTSVAWLHDGSGFFYCRYPTPSNFNPDQAEDENTKLGSETDKNEHHKIYFHKIGTDQSQDVLFYEDTANPNHMFGVEITDDGKYLIITVSYSTARLNKLYYAPITADFLTSKQIVKVVDEFKAELNYITNEGTKFLFQTNYNAPNSKVVAFDITSNTALESSVDILPEQADPLSYVINVNENVLIACYTHDVHDVLKVYDLEGKYKKDIELPAVGSIDSISGRKEDKEFFIKFASFTYPGTMFRYLFTSNELTVFYETKVNGLDLSLYETKQVWYTSKDGTKVPMFIVHKKGLELTGKNLCLLYGYGGFNIALKPYFSVIRVCLMQHFNAVFALANIRGGDEFGENWHSAGIKEKKQNVFDDFCAAAEYLINNKYTNPSKLAIQGGSNGGLLTAACVNQRPDLFGCVISQVPVIDMLRFHKFTIGYAWCSDYGCADNEDDFKYLIKYSPLHNVNKDAVYPAVLVLTSDHDDRVVPLHSYKFVATLQHILGGKSEQKQPLMAKVEVKAGHGAGLPLTKIIDEYTDVFCFMSITLQEKWQ